MKAKGDLTLYYGLLLIGLVPDLLTIGRERMCFDLKTTTGEDLSAIHTMATKTLGKEYYPPAEDFERFASHVIEIQRGYVRHICFDGKIIGYSYLIPLSVSCYLDLRGGLKGELEIEPFDIDATSCEKILYIADLVISNDITGYKRAQAASFLLKALANDFSDKKHRTICAFPVSKTGVSIASRRFGLQPTAAATTKTENGYPPLWEAAEDSVLKAISRWHDTHDH